MQQFLLLFIALPLLGFIISLFVPRKKERPLSWITLTTVALHLILLTAFIVSWLIRGGDALDIKQFIVYKSPSFEFVIDFYFDRITAVYAWVGDVIMLLVALFSRFYMHREAGFKRFFNNLLIFFAAYHCIIFSGNFETFFVGWELLGICSFLLIGFYRDRYLPVKNALKVISVYRLGDICLILALWLCHHVFHANITFSQLNLPGFVQEYLPGNGTMILLIGIMLLIGAAVKSGQFPFSSWVPRAMEGPTSSSAVFYGSLSVHIGVFLLLRTYPLWQDVTAIKVLVIVVGLVTALVGTAIARVQPTVKTQIAYSSVAQIGLMFIEVALGWHILALIHFSANAFLRTYQLLVSPSVLSYLIHDMFFSFSPGQAARKKQSKIGNSLYMLGIKEWNLDFFQYRFLWSPFKWLGKQLNRIPTGVAATGLLVVLIGGIVMFAMKEELPPEVITYLPIVFSGIGCLLVLRAFAERGSALSAFLLVAVAQCFITLSISFNGEVPPHQILIFLSGIAVAAITGFVGLNRIKKIDNDITLNNFHGYAYEQPRWAVVVLVSCLAMAGLPFTPTFLGIDLLFTHIGANQLVVVIFTAISFLFIEICLLRIYARIFLGQHKKAYHPIAYKSS